MNWVFRKELLILTCVVIAGCSNVQTMNEPATGSTNAQLVREPPVVDLPDVDLTPQLLYDILMGEIANQRKDPSAAIESLSRAAISSRDMRIAERATRLAIRYQDYDSALKTATLWRELQPVSTIPIEVLGVIYFALDRQDEAKAQFMELLKRSEADVGLALRRVAALLSQGKDQAKVLILMEQLVQLYANNPDAHYALAFLADRFKQPAMVEKAIDKALALKPGWEEAAVIKVSHLLTLKQFNKINLFSEEFLKTYPQALKFRFQYARILVEQDKKKEAVDQFKKIVQLDENHAEATFAVGLVSVQNDELQQAKEYLQRSLALNPENDQARLYLGQVSQSLKEYDEAAKWYRQISQHTFVFEAQVQLGSVIAKQKNIEEALIHLDSIQAVNEEQKVRFYLAKEQVLREAKLLDRAKMILDDALVELPDSTELLYARGLIASQLNMLELHEKDMRKLIAKEPENAHALNALGYTLADQTDRHQEALQLLEKAIALRPNDPFVLDSMGWVQYRLGNHQRAVDYLEKAISTRSDAEIAAHLGEVLWVMGDRTRAKSIWKEAVKRTPDNDVLLETIKRHE